MLSTKSTSAKPPAWRAISASSTCPRSISIATGGFMRSCSARQQYRRYGIRHTDCWLKKRAKSPEPHASRCPETCSNGWRRLRGITEDFVDFLRLRENKPLFTQVAARASETRAPQTYPSPFASHCRNVLIRKVGLAYVAQVVGMGRTLAGHREAVKPFG